MCVCGPSFSFGDDGYVCWGVAHRRKEEESLVEKKGKVNINKNIFSLCIAAVAGQRRMNHRRPAGERFVWAWKRKVYRYTQKNWGTFHNNFFIVLLVLPHTHTHTKQRDTAHFSVFFLLLFCFLTWESTKSQLSTFLWKKIIFRYTILIWFMEIWRHFFFFWVVARDATISNYTEEMRTTFIILIVLLLFTVRDYLIADVELGFLAKKNKQWNGWSVSFNFLM